MYTFMLNNHRVYLQSFVTIFGLWVTGFSNENSHFLPMNSSTISSKLHILCNFEQYCHQWHLTDYLIKSIKPHVQYKHCISTVVGILAWWGRLVYPNDLTSDASYNLYCKVCIFVGFYFRYIRDLLIERITDQSYYTYCQYYITSGYK